MGIELFDRRWHLTVAPLDGGEGLEISGLRVTFSVKQTITSEPNTASIQVYNLSEMSRGRIKTKDQGVELRVGYDQLEERVFSGVIQRLEHRREGTEIVTELECKDGGQDLLEPEFARSYSAGTSRRKVLNDILSAMPHTSKGLLDASGLNGSIPGRLSFSTTAKRALDKLALAWDFEWSIQDGALQVLDREGTREPVELAFVLNEATGLIGTPSVTGRDAPGFKESKGGKVSLAEARKRQTGAKWTSLLLPRIRPGSYVLLKSEFVTGAYKVESTEHKGDTHGDDWATEAEGRLI